MKNLTTELLDHCHSRLLGILWISQNKFCDLPQYFSALDHVMDGLLLKNYHFLKKEKIYQNQRINLFASPYFGRTLYVAHISYEEPTIKEDIKSTLQLFFSHSIPQSSQKEVLILEEILNTPLESYLQKLKKDFQELSFQILK